jgi:glycosyltransferase involved in cell wall biosynthesis
LSDLDPDVVQVHESDGGLVALLVAALRPDSSSPRLVALQQVSYLEEFRSVRRLRYRGRILGRPGWREYIFKFVKAPLQIVLGVLSAHLADLVLAPSQATAEELSRDYRVRGVEVLPNVLGGREVVPEVDESIGDRSGFLLYVGRLRIRKAVEVLFEALSDLDEESPDLLLVGEGEHSGALQQKARSLQIDSRVRFLGRRSPAEVRYLMSKARALVVPSIYEGMPLVILEGMQAALPVIASAVSGIPEVVEDGETGWLVPSEDPPELAAAIWRCWADPIEAERRGDAGAERLSRRFAADQVAALWLQLVVESTPVGRTQSGPADHGDREAEG